MTAATIWVLFAFLPPGTDRPPVMRVERFASAAACERIASLFPPTVLRVACLPSRQLVRAGVSMEKR